MPQGKGMFSTIGGYVKGMLMGAGARSGPMTSESAQSGYSLGQMVRGFATSNTGMGMLGGAAVGGMWGAASSDTSVIGGMAMGAAGGAGLGRYGGAGMRMVGRNASSLNGKGYLSSFGMGVRGQMRRDVRGIGSMIGANRAVSPSIAAAAPVAGTSSMSKASTTMSANSAVGSVARSRSNMQQSQKEFRGMAQREANMRGNTNPAQSRIQRRMERANTRPQQREQAAYDKWQRSNYYAQAPERQAQRMESRIAGNFANQMGLSGLPGMMSV